MGLPTTPGMSRGGAGGRARGGSRARAGFAVSPLVIILAVVVLGLSCYQATITYQAWKLFRGSTYATGAAAGTAVGPLLAAIGIGAVVSWMLKKSDRAFNLAAGLALLGLCVLLSIRTYNYINRPTGGPPPGPLAAGPTASPGDAAKTPEDLKAWTERVKREQAERLRSPAAPPPPPSGAPAPLQPVPAPQVAPQRPAEPGATPGGDRPGDVPKPAAPAPPKPRSTEPAEVARDVGADDTKSAPVLERVAADLAARIGEVAGKAGDVLAELGKPAAHDRGALEKRLDKVAGLRFEAEKLRDQLRSLTESTRQALVDAGVEGFALDSKPVQFSVHVGAGARAIACEQYIHLCDAAREHAQLLRDNMSKWRTDKDGQPATTEPALRGKLLVYRSRLESLTARAGQVADQLAGK